MANSEEIEARLCAYIEGDLDEAGRADIERHLQRHAQHRQLIKDLVRTRELVRDLPRAKAPGDLSESLQGQVERSMLLGADDTSMRISRWPQIGALAAVVVLAAGLGLVVFFVLRGSFNRPVQTPVIADSRTTRPEKPTIDATDNTSPDALAHVPLAANGVTSQAGGAVMATPALDTDAINQRLKDAGVQLPASGRPGASPLYVVVSARDSASANGAVAQYLLDNNIQYEPLTARDLKGDAMKRFAVTRSAMNSPPAIALAPNANLMNSTTNAEPNNALYGNAGINTGDRNRVGSNGLLDNVATRPTAGGALAVQKNVDVADRSVDTPSNTPSDAGRLYVARNLSPQQATQLGAQLSRSDPGLKCEVYTSSGAAVDAANNSPEVAQIEEPAHRAMAQLPRMQRTQITQQNAPAPLPGQTQFETQAHQQVAPTQKSEAELKAGDLVNVYVSDPASQVAEESVQTAVVDPTGTIRLKDVGEVSIRDQSIAAMEQTISKAYAAKSGTTPRVTVRKIEPAFADQPVAARAAIAPGAPADQDDKVDVVIVVNATNAMQSNPTTLPAAGDDVGRNLLPDPIGR